MTGVKAGTTGAKGAGNAAKSGAQGAGNMAKGAPKGGAPHAPQANGKKPGPEGANKPNDFGNGGGPERPKGGGDGVNTALAVMSSIPMVGDLVNTGKELHGLITGKDAAPVAEGKK